MSNEEIIGIVLYALIMFVLMSTLIYSLISHDKTEKVKQMWLRQQPYEIQKLIESYNSLTWEKPYWKHGKNNNNSSNNK